MCPNSLQITNMETPRIPDILKCDANELAMFLLKNRFQDDAVATASFLLEGAAALPNAEAISAQIMEVPAEAEEETMEEEKVSFDFGGVISESCDVSLTTPRGKFQWEIHDEGIYFENAKDEHLLLPSNSVERMILFPKPEDCRKVSETVGDMVLLTLNDGDDDDTVVTFKKKNLTQVCLQLPVAPPKLVEEDEDEERDWTELLCTSLDLDPQRQVARVYNPTIPHTKRSGYSFESHCEDNTSTTTGGMPFVKCHKGVQDGALFPMKEGLLFFKPPFFLSRSEMHSISCGRGSGGSRYVDMVVTVDREGSQEDVEFRNIHRDELQQLNKYIHGTLIPAMNKDANESITEEGSDNHSSDETQTSESAASPSSSGKQRVSKRNASRTAREINRTELSSLQNTESDDDEGENDDQWDSSNDDESISDGDMSLTGVHDVPVDDDSDNEDHSELGEEEEDLADTHIEDEDSGTESEDEIEPPNKKSRTA